MRHGERGGDSRIRPREAKLRYFELDVYRNILDKGQIQDTCKDAG